MLNANEMTEPRLSGDFAARVLERVEIVRARQRRVWRIAAVCAVVSFSAAAVATYEVAPWHVPGGAGARVEPQLVAVEIPGSQSGETGVLDFLFPDAAPVARFATQYSEEEGADSAPGVLDEDDADTS
jgi:hypothetical protein